MKDELRKSHDAMLTFLKKVTTYSDQVYGESRRLPAAQRHYNEAQRLIARAEQITAQTSA